mmetsp:Transcript_118108/g.252396  ORF Transcript_118108/g.252396 Transcript_118108/m.252396 type:complete len:206 (+) Transcript_118108:557-1174(+)
MTTSSLAFWISKTLQHNLANSGKSRPPLAFFFALANSIRTILVSKSSRRYLDASIGAFSVTEATFVIGGGLAASSSSSTSGASSTFCSIIPPKVLARLLAPRFCSFVAARAASRVLDRRAPGPGLMLFKVFFKLPMSIVDRRPASRKVTEDLWAIDLRESPPPGLIGLVGVGLLLPGEPGSGLVMVPRRLKTAGAGPKVRERLGQ